MTWIPLAPASRCTKQMPFVALLLNRLLFIESGHLLQNNLTIGRKKAQTQKKLKNQKKKKKKPVVSSFLQTKVQK